MREISRKVERVAMNRSTIHSRIDASVREEAGKILASLGMKHSEFVNLMYRQLVLRKGLPFDVKLPNAKTLEAVNEVESGKNLVGLFDDFDKLVESLEE
jgi:DNA-damage-inducible protein J